MNPGLRDSEPCPLHYPAALGQEPYFEFSPSFLAHFLVLDFKSRSQGQRLSHRSQWHCPWVSGGLESEHIEEGVLPSVYPLSDRSPLLWLVKP